MYKCAKLLKLVAAITCNSSFKVDRVYRQTTRQIHVEVKVHVGSHGGEQEGQNGCQGVVCGQEVHKCEDKELQLPQ